MKIVAADQVPEGCQEISSIDIARVYQNRSKVAAEGRPARPFTVTIHVEPIQAYLFVSGNEQRQETGSASATAACAISNFLAFIRSLFHLLTNGLFLNLGLRTSVRLPQPTIVSATFKTDFSFSITVPAACDMAAMIHKDFTVTSINLAMDPTIATSMAAHKPFTPRPMTLTLSPAMDGGTKITVMEGIKTPTQPHQTSNAQVKKPGTATPRKRKLNGPLKLCADKNFNLTNDAVEKIKNSDPFRPIDMPIISVNSNHGNMKVFLHCQTTRLYAQNSGAYVGDLPQLFPAANAQLLEALRERREQTGPPTKDYPEGLSFSSVLRADEVLTGAE